MDYHNYDLMIEQTMTYRMKPEGHAQEDNGSPATYKGFHGQGCGR